MGDIQNIYYVHHNAITIRSNAHTRSDGWRWGESSIQEVHHLTSHVLLGSRGPDPPLNFRMGSPDNFSKTGKGPYHFSLRTKSTLSNSTNST